MAALGGKLTSVGPVSGKVDNAIIRLIAVSFGNPSFDYVPNSHDDDKEAERRRNQPSSGHLRPFN
jgi:hypothetical protein